MIIRKLDEVRCGLFILVFNRKVEKCVMVMGEIMLGSW